MIAEVRESLVDGLVDLNDAAKFLCVSRSTLYRIMDSGDLPSVILPGMATRRIRRLALIQFVERATVVGGGSTTRDLIEAGQLDGGSGAAATG